MNEILFIISLVSVFTMVVLLGKFFGKTGLTTFACVAAILANLITPKQVTLFGIDVSMGAILFSSVYLCTDIISEKYGKEESKRAVNISLICVLLFIAVTQFTVLFKPNSYDYVSESMSSLFAMSIRVSISSVVMFYVANLCDVYLFDAIKKRTYEKLWLRNNIATIVCNCVENFLFIIGAFVGIYTLHECIDIALATCAVEVAIGLCDTPFVYWGRRIAADKEGN